MKAKHFEVIRWFDAELIRWTFLEMSGDELEFCEQHHPVG
jgi:hypothetical protein